MSEERVPKEFFSAGLLGKAAMLLLRMNPPGEVWLTHLDAPGWAVVGISAGKIVAPTDLAERQEDRERFENPDGGWSAQPIVRDSPPAFRDGDLSLTGMDFGDGIFWEWRGAPRTVLFGKCGEGVQWDEIRRLVSSIAPALTALLTPRDSALGNPQRSS